MSATILYRQVSSTGRSLSCFAPSSFIGSIEQAFGSFPCTLGEEAVPILTGMAAVCNDGGGNPYQELISAIEKLGTVEVWAKY